jgi:hypothetical protein
VKWGMICAMLELMEGTPVPDGGSPTKPWHGSGDGTHLRRIHPSLHFGRAGHEVAGPSAAGPELPAATEDAQSGQIPSSLSPAPAWCSPFLPR